MNFSRLKLRPLTIGLCALAAVACGESYLTSRNVLAFKRDWKLAQEGFINPGLNVLPSLAYRNLLAGYRLRSDERMGIQRLYSRESLKPRELKLWFRLGESGYVDALTGVTDHSYWGLRLSSSALFPSMIYQADAAGKYLSVRPLGVSLDPGVHTVTISADQLEADGKVSRLPMEFLRPGPVGVQISFRDTEIFGMRATGEESNLLLHFFPEGNHLALIAVLFLLLMVTVSLAGLLPRPKRNTLAGFILGLGAFGWTWSLVHGLEDPSLERTLKEFELRDVVWKPSDQESLRRRVARLREGKYFPENFLCTPEGCAPVPQGELPPKKRHHRILLFGGSQSRHSLVKSLPESFHFRLDQELRAREPNIETLNVNSQGLFRERLAKYGALLPALEPDEIIIETLSFDHEVQGIIDFIREWTRRGVPVIFLRRPVNPLLLEEARAKDVMKDIRLGMAVKLPADVRGLPEVLRVLPPYRRAQKEIGFTFLDPNALLLDEKVISSGEIFWDGFHFTGYGQDLMARWLAREYFRIHQSSK